MLPTAYQPAVYRGDDVTGTVVGKKRIIGRVGTHKYPSGRTHIIWRVECLNCNNEIELSSQKVMQNDSTNCNMCFREESRAQNSPHWTGGSFVPGYFVAKIQCKLSRRTRLLDYSLTLEFLDQLWENQDGRCAYTNLPLQFGNNVEECTASLDRIDSSGDYTEGNVQFVHKTINRMKWDLTDMEFKNFCVLVVKNLGGV